MASVNCGAKYIMANYAYIENNEISKLFDELPTSWKNVSNFHMLEQEELKKYNFYLLTKIFPSVTENTRVNPNPSFTFVNDVAYETYSLESIPESPNNNIPSLTEEQILNEGWYNIRKQRDTLMNDFEWRYSRYDRQTRLGLPTTDNLEKMDTYMQSLADITSQTDPFNIVWPEYIE